MTGHKVNIYEETTVVIYIVTIIVTPPVGKHLKTTKVEANIENTMIVDIDGLSKKTKTPIIRIDSSHDHNHNLDVI